MPHSLSRPAVNAPRQAVCMRGDRTEMPAMRPMVGDPPQQPRRVSSDFEVVSRMSLQIASREDLTAPWWERAACRGSKLDFTSDHPVVIDKAKRFCRTQCAVRDDCLRHALNHREPYGVWGGLDPHERLGIRPGMYAAEGRPIRRCLNCGTPFRLESPNARMCSEPCRRERRRWRDRAAYVRAGDSG